MLEETLQKTKVTNYIVDLHPSANRLFKTDNNFEKKYFGISKQITYKAELNKISPFIKDKAKHIGGKCIQPIAYGLYGSVEIISRTSETISRSVGRSINYLMKKIYNSFDKEEKTKFKKKVNKEKKIISAWRNNLIKSLTYHKQSEESKRKIKDIIVVSLSIYATFIGLSYITSTSKNITDSDNTVIAEQVNSNSKKNIDEKIE